MKTIINYITTIVTACVLIGCSGDDKTVDQVIDQVTSGAVLRTIDIDNNMIYNDLTLQFDEGSNYILTLEEQDAQQGGLLDEIEIYTRFIENTRVDTNNDGVIDKNDDDLSTEIGLIRTINSSDFQPGDRGVPVSIITFTAEELIAFTQVDESKIQGKDDFELRFLLKLTDGRSFSVDDANGNVSGGSYFSSPYTYRTTAGCTITETLAGTYTYTVTELISAPGGRSQCTNSLPTGEVTWSETDGRGEYGTTDISFGQFDNCYVDTFSKIDFDKIKVTWDCTGLVASGAIKTVEKETKKKIDFSYTYKITEISGGDMTIEFGNSSGDRGTVVLTRPGGLTWPVLFKAIVD